MPTDLSRLEALLNHFERVSKAQNIHGAPYLQTTKDAVKRRLDARSNLLAAIAEIVEENRRLKDASLPRD